MMNWMTSGQHRALRSKRGRQRQLMIRLPMAATQRPQHNNNAVAASRPQQSQRHCRENDKENGEPWYIRTVHDEDESLDVWMLESARAAVLEEANTTRITSPNNAPPPNATRNASPASSIQRRSVVSSPKQSRKPTTTSDERLASQPSRSVMKRKQETRCDFTPTKSTRRRERQPSSADATRGKLPSPKRSPILLVNDRELVSACGNTKSFRPAATANSLFAHDDCAPQSSDLLLLGGDDSSSCDDDDSLVQRMEEHLHTRTDTEQQRDAAAMRLVGNDIASPIKHCHPDPRLQFSPGSDETNECAELPSPPISLWSARDFTIDWKHKMKSQEHAPRPDSPELCRGFHDCSALSKVNCRTDDRQFMNVEQGSQSEGPHQREMQSAAKDRSFTSAQVAQPFTCTAPCAEPRTTSGSPTPTKLISIDVTSASCLVRQSLVGLQTELELFPSSSQESLVLPPPIGWQTKTLSRLQELREQRAWLSCCMVNVDASSTHILFETGELRTVSHEITASSSLAARGITHPPPCDGRGWWIATRTQRLFREVMTITRSTVKDEEEKQKKHTHQSDALRELVSTSVYLHTLLQCYRIDDVKRERAQLEIRPCILTDF